jgi:hypothetical protein
LGGSGEKSSYFETIQNAQKSYEGFEGRRPSFEQQHWYCPAKPREANETSASSFSKKQLHRTVAQNLKEIKLSTKRKHLLNL